MVAECPAKCATVRLREKTPTLRYGKYAGCSVRDVFRDQKYWYAHVARDPIKFLGSFTRFVEIDAREQQRMEQRLQERRDREVMQSNAASILKARFKKGVEKPPGYIYSGEEVFGAGTLQGTSFKNALYESDRSWLHRTMASYKGGYLRDPSLRDFARYVGQEYRSSRYHGDISAWI